MSAMAAVVVAIILAGAVGGGFYAFQSGVLDAVKGEEQPTQPRAEENKSASLSEEKNWAAKITNFEECASAGNPVLESYPRRCKTQDGIFFTEEIFVEDTVAEEAEEGTPVDGRTNTVEQFKSKPTLCEFDSDCKIIPITCNDCDCGRAVNNWIEPYACTEDDMADICPVALDCGPAKAVCDSGVCKKVDA